MQSRNQWKWTYPHFALIKKPKQTKQTKSYSQLEIGHQNEVKQNGNSIWLSGNIKLSIKLLIVTDNYKSPVFWGFKVKNYDAYY